MEARKFGLYFDERDYKLLEIVDSILDRKESFSHLDDLLYPYLHPHGIKELAKSRALRIAYAIIRMLESLECAGAEDRLSALRSLKDEVLNSADSHMRKNTARVLLQIMKELIRTRADRLRRLELAHDFRSAVSGKPILIRKLLREHHLLEMPEEWNQVTFDGHVHDSYTKGRKSPSHLIMDAWIKGIRHLTIVYYNFVDPEPVSELLGAAEIMDINVRVGIEFPAKFYDRTAKLIWVPRGFSDTQDFISFLDRPEVLAFMEEGRKVSEYQQGQVLSILRMFNENSLPAVNREFGLDLAPISASEFLSSIRTGQASILHLARFIHGRTLPAMEAAVAKLRDEYADADLAKRAEIDGLVAAMNAFDSETIVERFLRPECSPNTPGSALTHDCPGLPRLLRLSPDALIRRLCGLHSGCQITLNLTGLKCEDVLELLYDSDGAIGSLEIFNLKDYQSGKYPAYEDVSRLQQGLNEGDLFKLTRIVQSILSGMRSHPDEHQPERVEKFEAILRSAGKLIDRYKNMPLTSVIGSDSTGQSRRFYGMGFAVIETLPKRVRRKLSGRRKSARPAIPVRVSICLQTTFFPSGRAVIKILDRLIAFFIGKPLLNGKTKRWAVGSSAIRPMSEGNVVALGGVQKENNALFIEKPVQRTRPGLGCSWRYLNGILKNSVKIAAGFIPSVITFMYTQDWWFLVWLGTPIWFAITGLRNTLQSVFGGAGIRRSPILKWNSYVSWDRLSDSLLYTGLSVPLLEYLVKVLLMERTFNITTATNPVMLYSVMSFVNGVYISGHNILRGLPREAVIGNFFRAILNIPLSITFNSAIAGILGACGATAIDDILQQWASIISKTSSDVVAGIIEGIADYRNYMRIRLEDYKQKIAQLFDTYEKLEIMFPESDVIGMLRNAGSSQSGLLPGATDIEKVMIVNGLDLLYFWMYQPRAQNICISLLKEMSNEELQIFINSQAVLKRKAEIARLFVDGLVGDNWSRALAFYLDYCSAYLNALDNIYECLCIRTGIVRLLAGKARELSCSLKQAPEGKHPWTPLPRRN